MKESECDREGVEGEISEDRDVVGCDGVHVAHRKTRRSQSIMQNQSELRAEDREKMVLVV